MTATRFKVVLIGDTNVGKSSLLSRFINDTFTEVASPTIGIDFASHVIQKDRKQIRLTMYDTGGHERFHPLTGTYLDKANAVIIVFDVTNAISFVNVNRWIYEVQSLLSPEVNIVLIGNKCDLTTERVVDYTEANNFAKSFKIQYIETSAKNSSNIQEAFWAIINPLLASVPEIPDLDIESDIQPIDIISETGDAFKVIILGDSGVGKTSLLKRFTKDKFNDTVLSTLCFNVESHKINHNGTTIGLHIWDVCGKTELQQVAGYYCQDAKGIIVMFDVTNKESFENATRWLQQGDENLKRLLVGNKCDLKMERVISHEQAKNLADSLNIPYVEISVKDKTNVDLPFITLIS